MAFAALADLKNQLNIPSTDTSNDTELTLYLNAVNEELEGLIGPSASTAFTERQGATDGAIILMRRPIVSVETVTPVGGTVLLATAYFVDKDRGGIAINAGGTLDYDVAYHAGWAAIPARATLALLLIAQHLWNTQRGGMIPSVVAPEETVQIPGFGFPIPKRAAALVASLGGPAAVPGIA